MNMATSDASKGNTLRPSQIYSDVKAGSPERKELVIMMIEHGSAVTSVMFRPGVATRRTSRRPRTSSPVSPRPTQKLSWASTQAPTLPPGVAESCRPSEQGALANPKWLQLHQACQNLNGCSFIKRLWQTLNGCSFIKRLTARGEDINRIAAAVQRIACTARLAFA